MLTVTSSRSGEGKTTTTANLAVVLAQAGQRVLAIDCDLRKPRLHRFFGLDNDRGFTTALVEGSMQDALHELPAYGRLAVMPSGVVPPDPAELLASSRTDALFEKLLPHFDVIVVDSPPVLPVTDALVLSRMADAVLLVTSARKTSKRDVHRSVELLGPGRGPGHRHRAQRHQLRGCLRLRVPALRVSTRLRPAVGAHAKAKRASRRPSPAEEAIRSGRRNAVDDATPAPTSAISGPTT